MMKIMKAKIPMRVKMMFDMIDIHIVTTLIIKLLVAKLNNKHIFK